MTPPPVATVIVIILFAEAAAAVYLPETKAGRAAMGPRVLASSPSKVVFAGETVSAPGVPVPYVTVVVAVVAVLTASVVYAS